MQERVRKSRVRQVEEREGSATVAIPLPLIAALEGARSGFMDLCVEAGRQVLAAMMENDRAALCGLRHARDRERTAYRGGTTPSRVVLGGRTIAIARPRLRACTGGELVLPSFALASRRDPLDEHTLAALASGVSMRRYERSLEPVSAAARSGAASKSAVSRRFLALSEAKLGEWFSAPLHGLDLRVVMIDGIVFHDHCVLIALGIAADGTKHALGLREGSTENGTVAKGLLADLMERGLAADRVRLWVIDGGKALRAAIGAVYGASAIVQRCQVHKLRNVLGHLPERLHASVSRALRDAWSASDVDLARRQLARLAKSLERAHPSAAASIREGLDETLTLIGLRVSGALYRTLRSTNVIENLNGSVARFTRNVRRWRGGQMILRWVGAALGDATRGFRRVRGYADLAKLARALDQRVPTKLQTKTEAA